ncbi:MAG: hypothetical protein J6S75_09210, partial [Thermoguttaceae bacterium]|nr:hypothetical protein [Thermoguttaceae bacterium]
GFRSIGAETDRRLDVSRDVRVNVIGSLKTPPSDDSGEAKVSPYETPGRGIADGWSRPILFYPNGHTSSAVLFLASSSEPEPAYFAEVSLRGITGMVRAGAVSANPPGSGGFESVLSGEAFAQLRRDENPERDPMRRYGVIQGGEL